MPTNCPENQENQVSYGPNKLFNYSAEADLSGWTSDKVTVINGGVEGIRCFAIDPTGFMSQPVATTPDICLEGFQVKLNYLLETSSLDSEVKISLKVVAHYDDGTSDLFKAPIEKNYYTEDESVGVLDPDTAENLYQVDANWGSMEVEFLTKDSVNLVSVQFGVYNDSAEGKIYVDNLQLIDMYTAKYPPFINLPDTPSSYTGAAGQMVVVNSDENAVVFQNKPSRWIEFFIKGNATTGAVQGKKILPSNVIFEKVLLDVDTAPSGTNLLIDININGASIFTDLTRPSIASGTTFGSTTNFTKSFATAGDRLTFDIDQIGSTAPGVNLAVTVVCREVN